MWAIPPVTLNCLSPAHAWTPSSHMEWPKRKENCSKFAGFSKALSWEVPGSQRSIRGWITCTSVTDALSLDLEREAEFDLGRSHKPDQVRLCICIFPSPAAREGPLITNFQFISALLLLSFIFWLFQIRFRGRDSGKVFCCVRWSCWALRLLYVPPK